MAAWPGGNCPDCGDFMPPNLITCQTCRAMLNPDLKVSFVDVPDFIPLKEIEPDELEDSGSAIIESPEKVGLQVLLIEPKGIFYRCPGCNEELKVPGQFLKSNVQCNRCSHSFRMNLKENFDRIAATYVDCPYCKNRIRSSVEMNNCNVQCVHCQGALHIKFKPNND